MLRCMIGRLAPRVGRVRARAHLVEELGSHRFGEKTADVGRRPEHPLRRGVEQRHHTVGIECHDRVHRRAHDFRKPRLGLVDLAHVLELQLATLAVREQLLLGRELLLLLVQVDEDTHLRAQDVRLEWLRHVIDGAHRIPLEDVLLVLADRGEEDDRDVARTLARLDESRGFEAVDAGHLHVQQDHRHIMRQQLAQRLITGARAHEDLPERLEDRFEREEILGAVVDDEYLDRRQVLHRRLERRGAHDRVRPGNRQGLAAHRSARSGVPAGS